MNENTPLHLEILPPPQRRLWQELDTLPPEFVLYRGTGIALQLGHRQSADFDFFGNHAFEAKRLIPSIPFLAGATLTQRAPDTLSCIVNRGGPVKVSFFGVPRLKRVAPLVVVRENGVQIAALLDLAATKMSVVQMRAEARDYIDIDALLRSGRVDLPGALAAARTIFGPEFNPQITLKALAYFGDETVRELPDSVKSRLANATKAVDLDRLPAVREIVS